MKEKAAPERDWKAKKIAENVTNEWCDDYENDTSNLVSTDRRRVLAGWIEDALVGYTPAPAPSCGWNGTCHCGTGPHRSGCHLFAQPSHDAAAVRP